MRKNLLLLSIALLPLISFAQEIRKEQTKFEAFTSKTGSIIKFYDIEMPNIQLNYGITETSVRVIVRGDTYQYYYRIEKPETSSSIEKIAMIEYSDLVEINKALQILRNEAIEDLQLNPDYLENKFVTDDGVAIGYYVSEGKTTWYIKLERYTSSTIFPRNEKIIFDNFQSAQQKIEEVKKQGIKEYFQTQNPASSLKEQKTSTNPNEQKEKKWYNTTPDLGY